MAVIERHAGTSLAGHFISLQAVYIIAGYSVTPRFIIVLTHVNHLSDDN